MAFRVDSHGRQRVRESSVMPKTRIGRYFYNLAYSLDQLGNTIAAGDPDETISSRLGKMARSGKLRPLPRLLVWALDRLDRDHCIEAIETDEGGRAVGSLPRCDRCVLDGGAVVRCRFLAGHSGRHNGKRGPVRRRRWVSWD